MSRRSKKSRRKTTNSTMKKAAILWTGGKDSCIALHEAVKRGYSVAGLFTFTPESPDFLAHPLDAVALQAEALELPHARLPVTAPFRESYISNLVRLRETQGIDCVFTGDIDEVDGCSSWMEQCCNAAEIELIRPLWKMNRKPVFELAAAIRMQFVMTCVMPAHFDKTWPGRTFDATDLSELETYTASHNIDLCGENGEYHTMVTDAFLFKKRLVLQDTVTEERNGFYYVKAAAYHLAAK